MAISASSLSIYNTINNSGKDFMLTLPYRIMVDSDCGKIVYIKYSKKSYTGTIIDKCIGWSN